MKCKSCDAELEEGQNLCPFCGYDNDQEDPSVTIEESEPVADATEEPKEESAVEATEKEESEHDMMQEKHPEASGAKISTANVVLLIILAIAAVAVVAALIVGGLKGEGAPALSGSENAAASSGAESGAPVPAETVEPTIPADGNPDDVTCKGTYTVTDDEMLAHAGDVVATLGDRQLTNSELQIYYWMQFYEFMENYGSYASMFGLDLNLPLDMQMSMDATGTWQQFFLNAALNVWKNYTALATAAEENGFQLDGELSERLEGLPDMLKQTAEEGGFATVDDMIRADMGPGADLGDYTSYMQNYYLGYQYFGSEMDKISVSDQEIEAYFDENAERYAQNGLEKNDDKLVNVRHILVGIGEEPQSEDAASEITDEDWAECEAEAQAILDQFLAGDQSEESFGKLAGEFTDDPGSAQTGGLYNNVAKGQMVPSFDEWCFDAERQNGDYGLVKSEFGYHVMYYVNSEPVWSHTATQDLLASKGNEMVERMVSQYGYSVDFSKIVLGLAEQNQDQAD